MLTKTATLLLGMLFLLLPSARWQNAKQAAGGETGSNAPIKFPENYRKWVYLTTGFDMSYTPGRQANHHMFDNVFVNPEAYQAFVETGTWPDKTMLVLEVRGARDKGSINVQGNYQDTEVMGIEVHMKDEARFPDKWAFVGFDDNQKAEVVPKTAACYSCHEAHAAVDTTFVQFYPTLLPVAKSKATLSAWYLKEVAAQDKK